MTYHKYTPAQCQYLTKVKIPKVSDSGAMRELLLTFVGKFESDADWTEAPSSIALRNKAIQLQRAVQDEKDMAKRLVPVDKLLETYLGDTIIKGALLKITAQINKENHECFKPEEIKERLEFLTKLAGGSDKEIVAESTEQTPAAPEKTGSRYKYTAEENHFLLTRGPGVVGPKRANMPNTISIKGVLMERLCAEFNEKFELDISVSTLTEKVRNLLMAALKKTPKPMPTSSTPVKEAGRWKVILGEEDIWEGNEEPELDVAKSMANEGINGPHYIIINGELIKTVELLTSYPWTCKQW